MKVNKEFYNEILRYINNINIEDLNKTWKKKEIENELLFLKKQIEDQYDFLNFVNLYDINHKSFVIIFNYFFIPYLEQDIANILKKKKFYKTYFERLKFIFDKNTFIEDFNLLKVEEIFHNFIFNEIKNIKSFSDKNVLYYKLKNINSFINFYIINIQNIVFNHIKDNSTKIIIKNKYKKLLKKLVELNDNIVKNNEVIVKLIFGGCEQTFYNLFPFYFFVILNNIIILGENHRNLNLEKNVLYYTEFVERNPFLNLTQSKEKLLKTIYVYNNVFIYMYIQNFEKNVEKLNSKEFNLINKQINENIKYFIKELILLNNTFQLNEKRIKRNYEYFNIQDKQYIEKYYMEAIKNNPEINYKTFKNLVVKYLNIIYEENCDDFFNLNFNFLIIMNFVQNFYFLIKKHSSIHYDEEFKFNKIEELITRTTTNHEKYLKNLNIPLTTNIYDLINLYRFIKISYYSNLFDNILEQIVFSIKNYNLEMFKKYLKDLKNIFLLNDTFIIYLIIDNSYILTDDIVEILNLDTIFKFIESNKFITIKLIDKISNINYKNNKILIRKIMELYPNDQEILRAFKNIGININLNILEETKKFFN